MERSTVYGPWCMDPKVTWLGAVLLSSQDERRMARFAQYAMVASEEALKDAGWNPKSDEDLEATVCCYARSVGRTLTKGRVFTWVRV